MQTIQFYPNFAFLYSKAKSYRQKIDPEEKKDLGLNLHYKRVGSVERLRRSDQYHNGNIES